MKKILIPALAALILSGVACTQTGFGTGVPFDELSAVQESDVYNFFKALPDDIMPEQVKAPEAREKYIEAFRKMSEDGVFADGEDSMEATTVNNNALYWSAFLDSEEEAEAEYPVPFLNLFVYHGTSPDSFFGVVSSGSYTMDGPAENADRFYWFEKDKLSPATLSLKPQYTTDDLTSDVLVTYGNDNLFYAVKDGKFFNNYHDRGLIVQIEDVGMTPVAYEWNGVEFVRDASWKIPCIYNYGFANMMMGETVPFSIPGYDTATIDSDNPFMFKYSVTRKGETSPSLIISADNSIKMTEIEVFPSRYRNPYGIYPGMSVNELRAINDRVTENWGMDASYFSVNDAAPDFVDIYLGFDEDFIYRVPKASYLGEERFANDAKISSIIITNAVG